MLIPSFFSTFSFIYAFFYLFSYLFIYLISAFSYIGYIFFRILIIWCRLSSGLIVVLILISFIIVYVCIINKYLQNIFFVVEKQNSC